MFQTAHKMTSHPKVLAGAQDQKTALYYTPFVGMLNKFKIQMQNFICLLNQIFGKFQNKIVCVTKLNKKITQKYLYVLLQK